MGLSHILSALDKKYKGTIVDISDVESTVDLFYLDTPQFNFALGGAFADGRIYEFYGPESSGKTLLSMKIASEIQKRSTKNTVVFVDFEHTFDKAFYKKIFPTFDWSKDKFIYINPLDGETAFDIIKTLIETGEMGLVIWDSVATTPTKAILEKEFGAASFGGTANLMSSALKKINPYVYRFKTSLIFINQVRAAMDAYTFETIPGGKSLPFYASARFRISRVEDIKVDGVKMGILIKAKNKKNKIGIPDREALFTFRFDKGFDVDKEYIDFIISLGIVKQAGAWITGEEYGIKVNGKEKLHQWLLEHMDVYTIFKNSVNSMLCNNTELDKDKVKETDDYVEDDETLVEEK